MKQRLMPMIKFNNVKTHQQAWWSWSSPEELLHAPDRVIRLSMEYMLSSFGEGKSFASWVRPALCAEFKRRKRYRVKAVEYKVKGLIQ